MSPTEIEFIYNAVGNINDKLDDLKSQQSDMHAEQKVIKHMLESFGSRLDSLEEQTDPLIKKHAARENLKSDAKFIATILGIISIVGGLITGFVRYAKGG